MSGLLPCDPTSEETGGAHGMFGLFRLANFSSTRVIVWVSVYTSICLARQTNCCPLSAENSTATNLTQHGPFSDLSRSTAFHYCASRSFNHHHFCRGTPTTAQHNGLAVNACRKPPDSLLKKSLYSSQAANFAPAHPPNSSSLHCPSVHSYSTAALTPSAAVRVLLGGSIRECFFVLPPPVTRT